MWSSHLSALGKFEYILNGNVELFRSYLKQAILVYQELFELYEAGKPIHPSYVSMSSYKELFEALATGDIEFAKVFASWMGGRTEIEKENDTFFAIALGYALKYFVEEAEFATKKAWVDEFTRYCQQDKKYFNFIGYGTVFTALLEKNVDKANQGFKEIIQGHEAECKGRGDRFFKETREEDRCVWGVGLANLAIYYGLQIDIDHPLIPKELLMKQV